MINLLKRRKVYIILIIILIIYFVIVYYFVSNNENENKKKANIIVNGINAWKYENSTWEYIYEFNEINNKDKYKIYLSNNYIGDYKIIVNNNRIYAFDNNNNSLQYNEPIIAINSNYDIDLKNISYSEYTDEDNNILSKIMSDYSIYTFRNNKILIDLDNDGNIETLYIVNCYNSNELVFSGIYLYNGKLLEIVRSDDLNYISYNIESFIDIDNDNNYELLISSTLNNNTSYKIYKEKGNNYIEYLD